MGGVFDRNRESAGRFVRPREREWGATHPSFHPARIVSLDAFHFEKHIKRVNVISQAGLLTASAPYPQAHNWVKAWLILAKRAVWTSLADVRQAYPATDQVERCLIFDVNGNNFRLIVTVVWARVTPSRTNGALYIKHFLPHAEYSKDYWKGCCK